MNTDFQYQRHHVSLQKTIYGNWQVRIDWCLQRYESPNRAKAAAIKYAKGVVKSIKPTSNER